MTAVIHATQAWVLGQFGAGTSSGLAATTDGQQMVLTYLSPSQFGISRTTGCPYFNSAAVTAGDEAIFVVGSDGSLSLVQL